MWTLGSRWELQFHLQLKETSLTVDECDEDPCLLCLLGTQSDDNDWCRLHKYVRYEVPHLHLLTEALSLSQQPQELFSQDQTLSTSWCFSHHFKSRSPLYDRYLLLCWISSCSMTCWLPFLGIIIPIRSLRLTFHFLLTRN